MSNDVEDVVKQFPLLRVMLVVFMALGITSVATLRAFKNDVTDMVCENTVNLAVATAIQRETMRNNAMFNARMCAEVEAGRCGADITHCVANYDRAIESIDRVVFSGAN